MKRITRNWMFLLAFILGITGVSYCAQMDIADLVDKFQNATDLQKDQILADNLGKEITAGGVVINAGEYDFFDTVNDIKGTYYQVGTEQQKTKNNTLYQLIFLFKDKDKAKDIDKGQLIQKDGSLIRITDERLQIAVWIFCGELTDSDKALFKQD